MVVLSGAGISAESGIKTFRDSNGLWENHRIEEVASLDGYHKNPQLVLDFYNLRRRQLKEVSPNSAHYILAELENYFDVFIVTQNVDDLHERAGSSNVMHLHGELLKVKPLNAEFPILEWTEDLHLGDQTEDGVQLRPHIVWFGEAVPNMQDAINLVSKADLFLIIGTSLQVYPAAGLIHETHNNTKMFIIDPSEDLAQSKIMHHIKKKATEGMEVFKEIVLKNL